MNAWTAWTGRLRAAVGQRRAAAERRRVSEDRQRSLDARESARARRSFLVLRRQELLDRWQALERADPALAAAAAVILAVFKDGVRPPACSDRSFPAGRAWTWLLDNGLVTHRHVAAQPPIVQSGPHVYGHRGFDGHCVTTEARDVFRHLFGGGTWHE